MPEFVTTSVIDRVSSADTSFVGVSDLKIRRRGSITVVVTTAEVTTAPGFPE